MVPELCLGFQGWRTRGGGNVRKGADGCSSGMVECNVNPRAGTVIFLFLVTHKCTERSEREDRKRLDREQFRERDTWAETLKVVGSGERRGRKSQTPKK